MRETWRKFRRNRLALVGLGVIALYALMAAGAPWVAPYAPQEMTAGSELAGPGRAHWLGADDAGRDILSRIVHGARISLQVALAAVAIALVAGTGLGLLAGYFGRFVDTALSRLIDMMLSLPDILLALVLVAILGAAAAGGSMMHVVVAIGIVYTPIFARIARGSVLQVKENAYIEAARALGMGHVRIMLRHVLPNITAPLVVQTTLSLAFAILAEAALSFLGLGVGADPRRPSWGMMLNEGTQFMQLAWWMAVFPGLAITLAVFSFNVLGDGLRDALDPRE
jgi:peptide/nickel transport system permease protein